MKKSIELGRRVKDSITGFIGIAVDRTEFLYCCPMINVRSEELREGRPLTISFDEAGLEYDDNKKKVEGFK